MQLFAEMMKIVHSPFKVSLLFLWRTPPGRSPETIPTLSWLHQQFGWPRPSAFLSLALERGNLLPKTWKKLYCTRWQKLVIVISTVLGDMGMKKTSVRLSKSRVSQFYAACIIYNDLQGIPRSEIFITSKLWGTYHSRVEECLDQTLANLGTDYLDLYLVHWPIPMNPKGNHPVRS